MALSKNSVISIQDALTSVSAGNELANAIQNGCTLSPDTFRRLQIAMDDDGVGSDIQAAILGNQSLSIKDIQYMVDGFASQRVAGDVANNIAGGISLAAQRVMHNYINIVPNPLGVLSTSPAANVSMPGGFSLTETLGASQLVHLTFPAGSAFPTSGPGSFFEISNVGNANRYAIWFNVTGAAPSASAAQTDAHSTYTTLSTMTSTPISATLDGQTLTPGVYSTGAASLAGSGAAAMTFNGAGVYVIITASTLTTGAGGAATMTLSGGALAKNIYWIVGSSATINSGTAGTFQGNIIAQASVTDTLGGTVNGSLIALSGAVTLSAAAVVNAELAPLLPVAGSYGLLGAAGVTNTGSTVVTGNVGSFPTASVTGFPPGVFTPISTGNTNPTPGGFTGIEVTVGAGDSANTVAADVFAALNGNLIGMNESLSAPSVDITINPITSQVGTASFSPPAGTYTGTHLVSLSSTTCNVTFYYTTNGSTPTRSSTLYTGPISVATSETIKVLGVKNGFMDAVVASAAYTII